MLARKRLRFRSVSICQSYPTFLSCFYPRANSDVEITCKSLVPVSTVSGQKRKIPPSDSTTKRFKIKYPEEFKPQIERLDKIDVYTMMTKDIFNHMSETFTEFQRNYKKLLATKRIVAPASDSKISLRNMSQEF